MSAWRLALALLFVAPALASAAEPAVTRLDDPMPERILFVGNSYLYYNGTATPRISFSNRRRSAARPSTSIRSHSCSSPAG